MTRDYHGENYKLYMDNYYTSYNLIKKLEEKKIYVSGTLINRGGPEDIKTLSSKTKKDHFIVYQKNGVTCYSWHDKKLVSIMNNLVNINKEEISNKNMTSEKINIIKDYDKFMGVCGYI
ncbi:hypothetical protein DMUE_5000 [Dictyocoela muelleri]|nr:hypothetical protein DMUE_5000 [Dictyocoela muelleri]